jgi:hypothetical protein
VGGPDEEGDGSGGEDEKELHERRVTPGIGEDSRSLDTSSKAEPYERTSPLKEAGSRRQN